MTSSNANTNNVLFQTTNSLNCYPPTFLPMTEELFIVDVDPGLDDARALLYLLNSKKIKLLAITTCSGNVLAPQSSYNAGLCLSAVKNTEIPVHEGMLENLVPEIKQSTNFYGVNGTGDLELPPPTFNKDESMEAHKIMHKLALENPQKITLCCLGPVTNLARCYNYRPEVVCLFKKIFILAGDRAEKYAEFNALYDPTAYEIVLKNFGKLGMTPIILFDWTLCNRYNVSQQFFNDVADGVEKQATRLEEAKILRAKRPPNPNLAQLHEIIYLSDELVACSAVNQTIITKTHTITLTKIHHDPVKRGHTEFECASSEIHLVDAIDFEKWKAEFQDTMLHKNQLKQIQNKNTE